MRRYLKNQEQVKKGGDPSSEAISDDEILARLEAENRDLFRKIGERLEAQVDGSEELGDEERERLKPLGYVR